MKDELKSLIETAIKKEIDSRALYEAARTKVKDPIAKNVLKALAEEEEQHLEKLRVLTGKTFMMSSTSSEMMLELKKSEFMLKEVIPKDISVADILLLAIKREQAALEFFSKMCSVYKSKEAKTLCEELTHEELKHKVKLELMYEDIIYG